MNTSEDHLANDKPVLGAFFKNRSLTSRMLLLGLPVLAAVLLLIFAATGSGIEFVVNRAIARNAQLQTQAISLAMEQALEETRNQLLILAAGSMNVGDMADRMKFRAKAGGLRYRELAFEGLAPENRYLLLNVDDDVVNVPLQQALASPTGPFHALAGIRESDKVNVSQPQEVLYSMVPVQGTAQNITIYVLRFTTPVYDNDGRFSGYLMLSLDLRELRDILSVYSAPNAPLQTENEEQVRTMFFDREGWMLFQSEPVNDHLRQRKLSTDTVRAGLTGVFGRPGFNTAFRPGPEHISYWDMVVNVQNGRSGNLPFQQRGWGGTQPVERVSYVPLRFIPGSGDAPVILGGLAVLDTGFTTTHSGMQLMGIYTAAFVLGTLLLGLSLWWLSRQIGRSLNAITAELERCNAENDCRVAGLPPMSRDLERLKNAINALLDRLRDARDARKRREAAEDAQQRRAAVTDLPRLEDLPPDGLVGFSPAMHALCENVRKAAKVMDDVLVVGETGTGKELISEAIHHLSARASGPFITINCGALDENLLMDTLFGHVKGAFTEARAPRKGAFLAAEGGTLMLDEVGNAAPRVQQALLRALSTRRIRPLGSDHDVPFDTRIIAATNAPLLEEAQRGSFREDLYYRLAVITINSPPLRERKADIPALTVYFLDAAFRAGERARSEEESGMTGGGTPPQISRGAMDKLLEYDWPGNVRELKNTLTRALAFCDGPILYEEDIRIDATTFAQPEDSREALPGADDAGNIPSASAPLPQRLAASAPEPVNAAPARSTADMPAAPHPRRRRLPAAPTARPETSSIPPLPPRLRDAWPQIAARGGITRQEYQEMAGGSISMRTAQYDLQMLVQQGLVRKEGRGPTQRYVVVRAAGQLLTDAGRGRIHG